MLHLIVTGRSLEPGQLRNVTLSLAAHATLVVAIVAARPTSPVRTPHAPGRLASLERVHYVIASAPPEVKARAVRHARAASPAKLMAPKVPTIALDIPAPALDIATDTGELDLASKIVDSSDFAPRTLAEAIGASLVNRRATTTPADGIYRAESVDRVVTPFGDNPRPAYPRSLEAAGVEADFTVMFVVDSTGRVEERSVDVPRNVHRMFADAVRYALARSRYLPAQLGGQAVRQLVAQEFVFRMQR